MICLVLLLHMARPATTYISQVEATDRHGQTPLFFACGTLLVLKGEWGREFRYHYSGIYGDQ